MKKNNTILITGATGNIGGAVARRFSEHGWRVIAPVRKLEHNPKALALRALPGLHVAECNIEDVKAARLFIRSLANAGDVPAHVLEAAGVFLWDDGFPNVGQFASPQEVEDFLMRANCMTKENINGALLEYMPWEVGRMHNRMIGSHASTWGTDDPRRNGPFTEEYYVRSMQRVESIGESMKSHFALSQVLHTPLIDTPETRRTFTPERAPDITDEVWKTAVTPQEYAVELYPDEFFAASSAQAA